MRSADLILLLSAILLPSGCGAPAAPKAPSMPSQGTYEDDVAFLRAHGEVIELADAAGARVAVSPTYQGRVMTSAVAPGGASLGWVHRAFIAKGATGTPFDNYGGEDRFWLGPEGGQFGLYFPPGAPYAFDAWQTPRALQEGAWEVTHRGDGSVTFARAMTVVNHAGTTFEIGVEREVRLVPAGATSGARAVAYETVNRVTNRGRVAWTPATGLVSVWILGMFAPAADAVVVVPYAKDASGPVVNDAYFGKVPEARLAARDGEGHLAFLCDGRARGKIGVPPARSRGVAASYSASAHLLTVVTYDPRPAPPARYVNSAWEEQKEPYAGDVINAYNDGPTAPGKPSLGGFYEIETSSPGAELAPGASIVHTHRTLHVVGDAVALDAVARARVGVPLERFRL